MSECNRKSCRDQATIPFLPFCSADCALIDSSLAELPVVGGSNSMMTVGAETAVMHALPWLDSRARDAS